MNSPVLFEAVEIAEIREVMQSPVYIGHFPEPHDGQLFKSYNDGLVTIRKYHLNATLLPDINCLGQECWRLHLLA